LSIPQPGTPKHRANEVDRALHQASLLVRNPLPLVAPRPNVPLLFYVAAISQVVSAVLVAEREEDPNLAESRARGYSA
jgi:hypothetical protein